MKDETTNSHAGHRSRQREKIEQAGLDHLPPHEVLEYILYACIPRKDTNEISHRLIQRFGSLAGVLEAGVANLEKVEGISHNAAVYLSTLPQIARYYLKDRWRERPLLKDSIILGSYLCDLFAGEKNEVFYVLSLDMQCGLIKTDLVYRGTINEVHIYPRLIVELVLANNAAAVVLAHNHPSGNLMASDADINMTKQLVELFTGLSIRVLDHVIVSGERFSSMKAKGYVDTVRTFAVKDFDEEEEINGDWYFE